MARELIPLERISNEAIRRMSTHELCDQYLLAIDSGNPNAEFFESALQAKIRDSPDKLASIQGRYEQIRDAHERAAGQGNYEKSSALTLKVQGLGSILGYTLREAY